MSSSSDSMKQKFQEAPVHVIGWIHVKDKNTTALVNNFKRVAGNVRVKEIASLEELKTYIVTKGKKSQKYKAMVTEMGFWEDEKHTVFNRTAGLIAMELINQWAPDLQQKFVVSMRVAKNEDGLKEKTTALGFKHTQAFEPICEFRVSMPTRERELHECVSLLRNNLFAKPLKPAGHTQYPITHFNIKKVWDVETEGNLAAFSSKGETLVSAGKSNKWEWLFHGSNSDTNTFNIAATNFSLKYLGVYSGNRGFYGEGVYFSTRGYLPMVIAITSEHLLLIACKVMKGKSQENIKMLSKEEYTRGVPIPDPFDSNISDNNMEVVIRDPDQILPSFVIQFSVEGLELVKEMLYNTPQGDKTIKDVHCNEHRLLSFI